MSNLGYFVVGLGLLAGYLVAMAAVLFGAAGTLAVPMFWAYLVLFAVLCLTASAAVYLLSSDLVKERVRPGECQEFRAWGHNRADGGRVWRSRRTRWTIFWLGDGEQDRVTVPAPNLQ